MELAFEFSIKDFELLSKEELYTILALRQEVFVVEQNCPYLDADGMDQKAFHLIAYHKKNTLLAYARIFGPGIVYPDHCAIGRVLVKNNLREKGIGRKIMEIAIEQCHILFPENSIKISAQSYLLAFYQSMDFEVDGEEYLEDDIPHRAMILK